MSKHSLSFDPQRHEYRLNGNVVPSVTQIVRAVIPRQFEPDPWYLQRGSMVHKAVALMLCGELDWASVDERILPRVRAAQAYWQQNVNRICPLNSVSDTWLMEIEKPGCHAPLGFAGTPDLRVGGALLDWKSSAEPEAEAQLGGYVHFYPPRTIRTCICVELRDDGTYRETCYDARRCAALFLNVLTVYQWMNKHGRL